MLAERIRRYIPCLLAFLVMFTTGKGLFAKNVVNYGENFRPGSHHIELRDLGTEFSDLIAADESAITSLVEGPDGNIYGGTTGGTCHLFVFSLLSNSVEHLGKISGQESIHHSLVADDEGTLYFGTCLNELKQYPISPPLPGHAGITRAMWADIEKRYSKYEGGHLYKLDITKKKKRWIGNDEECLAGDLGTAVAHNGIYAMTINNKRKEIYGVTYPYGHFFVYYIEAGKFADMGQIYKEKVYPGPDNRTLRGITRALVCDNNGYVYGSADGGVIFRYDPEEKKITKLDVKIPAVYYSVVEAFAKDVNGTIYGGTSEGYLFMFEPEKMKVTNLGKPLAQMRIRGLTIGKNGIIYGIAGERTNHCRLFSYDISGTNFSDLGLLKVDRDPYYSWMAKQMDTIVTGKDGVVYIGESERRSHLFLFYP